MQRLLTTTILVGLLVATAAAFAVTERLKLTKSPLMPGTRVSKVFSPTCSCARSRANIRIKLRRADLLTVTMLDARKQPIRTLVGGVDARRGLSFFHWDGRTDGNVVAHDGTFYAEVHLASQHQTIVLPNRIELDTTKPLVKNVTLNRDEFSPDKDGQADHVRISYDLSKPAHVLVYLDGHRILLTHAHQASGSVTWKGMAQGLQLPPGAYTLGYSMQGEPDSAAALGIAAYCAGSTVPLARSSSDPLQGNRSFDDLGDHLRLVRPWRLDRPRRRQCVHLWIGSLFQIVRPDPSNQVLDSLNVLKPDTVRSPIADRDRCRFCWQRLKTF